MSQFILNLIKNLLFRPGLGKPSIANSLAVDRKFFSILSIYGRSYLIHLIISTQIGANFKTYNR